MAHVPRPAGVLPNIMVTLNDTDFNKRMAEGIEEMIDIFKTRVGRAPTVLVIGAGSGIVPIMALEAGAAHVTGLEANADMAHVAQHQIAEAFPGHELWDIQQCLSVDYNQGPHDMLICNLFGSMLNSKSMYVYAWNALRRGLIRNFGIRYWFGCR